MSYTTRGDSLLFYKESQDFGAVANAVQFRAPRPCEVTQIAMWLTEAITGTQPIQIEIREATNTGLLSTAAAAAPKATFDPGNRAVGTFLTVPCSIRLSSGARFHMSALRAFTTGIARVSVWGRFDEVQTAKVGNDGMITLSRIRLPYGTTAGVAPR